MTSGTSQAKRTYAGTGSARRREDPRARPWIEFAGVMILIAGVTNVIGGIAAIGDSDFFVRGAHFIVGDLTSLGWLLLVVGAVQLVAALGIWAQNMMAVFVGLGTAGANAVLQLFFLSSQPLLSLAIFAVDLLVLRALTKYVSAE
jgi:hypothetical protein